MFKGDRNFTVGLFVTLAIALFVAFVIWLTGRGGTEEMTRYTLKFTRDVSGLAVGGPVNFMGMKIGSVIHMDLERKDGVRVRVDIEILETTPVSQGTYASLALQGITGVAVVNLASESGQHAPLPDPPRGEYPEIPVRDVGFAAVLASAPQIMNKLDSLLTEMSKLLGQDNRDKVDATLQNVQKLTAALADRSDTLASLPQDVSQAVSDIQATLGQLQELLGQLQPGLASTVSNLDRSSENLARLTNRFDQLMREHEGDLDRFVADGLGEVPELMGQTRATLRELEKLVAELQDDPSQLIHRPSTDSLEIDP